jgi:acyl-coenzyme A thioesterase PaaI-like protein
MFKKTQIKQFEKNLIQYGLKHNYIEKEKDGTLKFVGSKNQKNKSVKPKNNMAKEYKIYNEDNELVAKGELLEILQLLINLGYRIEENKNG